MMKNIAAFIIVFLLVFGSFFLGVKAGIAKRSASSFATTANGSISKLERIQPLLSDDRTEEEQQDILDSLEVGRLVSSIVDYGYYLNHWSSKVPDLTGIDAGTHNEFRYIISYYLETHNSQEFSLREADREDFDRALESVRE